MGIAARHYIKYKYNIYYHSSKHVLYYVVCTKEKIYE